jgi:arsenate reductase
LKRIHFVCVGNCCRSQIAEGFARHLGGAEVVASSSGLAPTREIAWETTATMRNHGIDITAQYPKKFDPYGTAEFDLIVNLSGFHLPGKPVPPVEEWPVRDPYGETGAVYEKCAAEIEKRLQSLLLKLSGPPIAS